MVGVNSRSGGSPYREGLGEADGLDEIDGLGEPDGLGDLEGPAEADADGNGMNGAFSGQYG